MPAKKNKNAAKQQKATAPASSEVAAFSAKMLLSEVESPETECVRRCKAAQEPVSYTHLTLPTILLV